MATKAFKQGKADSIKEKMEKAQVAIVTEYKGMTVEEIQTLRRALQKVGGDYMVTKNTLAKLAIKGTQYEVLAETFKGPIAVYQRKEKRCYCCSRFRRSIIECRTNKSTCRHSFKRRTLCKNAWLRKFTCNRYRWRCKRCNEQFGQSNRCGCKTKSSVIAA